MQAIRGRDVDAARALFHHGAELPQDIQVIVDGPVADLAATQIRDEGLADRVNQRSAQKDGNPRIAGVRINCRAGGRLCIFGIQGEVARYRILHNGHAVQLQQAGDNLDVLDFRHVPQHRWFAAQQRRHHGLGHQVLGTANGHSPGQRDATADCQNTTHLYRFPHDYSPPKLTKAPAKHRRLRYRTEIRAPNASGAAPYRRLRPGREIPGSRSGKACRKRCGHKGRTGGLEGGDVLFVLERQANIVQALQQPIGIISNFK